MSSEALELGEQRALLEAARDGDAGALERLLADFRPVALGAVYRTLAQCGVGAEHAEDVLQAAAVRFISRGLEAYRGDSAPRTYFTRIAVNAAVDAVRLLSRARQLDETLATGGAVARALAPRPDAEQQLGAAQMHEALHRCVEALSVHYRQSVELYYLEEHGDCARCADTAGVSRAAFMQRLARARALLAKCLRRRLRQAAPR